MTGGGASSRKKQKKSIADLFTDAVFSWSLEDVFNEDLFKSKVQKIPGTFQSVEHYLGSYVNPLLEETRAELRSSMEVLDRAPFAEITSFQEVKPHGTKAYQIKVDYWRNKPNNGGRNEPYITLPGDVFVLAHGKPASVSDLQRAGKSWAFLSVTNIKGNVGTTQFRVKASKEFEHNTQMYIIFLANLIPQKRIWEALHMSSNVELINKVLRIDSAVKGKCHGCSKQSKGVWDEKLAKSLSSELNESQTRAVLSCLHMLQCKNKSALELIWGPPGTGKTKTTSTLLVTLLKRNCKTLVCAPTNVAITEVASRVLKMVSNAHAGALFCSLGDILLFGTKERLNIGSDMEQIYLDYRVTKLAECFGPLGWKHWFSSMINLLENCVFQYHDLLENDFTKKRDQRDESRVKKKGCRSDSEVGKKNLSSFLDYLRERFDSTFSELKSCVSITCTHTAKSYILKRNFQSMVSIIRLLDSFQELLSQADVVSEALEELFSPREVIGELSHSSADEKSFLLFMKRSECLSSLRTLQDSLNRLDFSDFRSQEKIKQFCFQRASLIFCTVSSSSKLHKLEVKPTILVIDEAAQLKECESTIPLQLPGLKHAILVGDEWQLPATIKSKVSLEAGFGRSLFERLSSQNHAKHLLNIQYRMHPSISIFPNSEFYQNQIQDADIVKKKIYDKNFLPGSMFGPYSFINIIGGREEKDADGHSRKNMVEVAVILKILQNVYNAWHKSQSELSIGIVSPYAAQVAAVQVKLGKRYDNIKGFQVKVRTVDGFQGGEEDIIIMSTVRADRNCSLDFISKPQRINVALTRARHCLWILGEERTLTNGQSVWKAIVIDAKIRGCFFNADSDEDLAKAITVIKKESGQFDDILNANSILFKTSRWKVLFGENFMKSFKKLTSFGKRKAVIDFLLKLSDGWRPRKHLVAVSGSSLEINNFKVLDLCVVSTVDIEATDSGHMQVLRIWDLLHPQDIPELVKYLDCIFEKYPDDFTNLCNEKCLEGKLELPKSWPPASDIAKAGSDLVASASNGKACVENSSLGGISLGMKFYSLSNCVVNHMLSDRDARELDLPLELPDQEKAIILFDRSAFILGRSGTGKTTVLTMKLFQKEYLHSMTTDELYGVKSKEIGHVNPNTVIEKKSGGTKGNVLRQLFVTASPKICNSVKQHLSGWRSSHSAETNPSNMDGNDSEETEFKNIPRSFRDVSPDLYPLVISFHQFLMMLDGTLSKSYFEKFIDMSELSQSQNPSSRSDVLWYFTRIKEVNHERFTSQYWPHLNSQLTKKLDPSRVFTEIISHIKGGLRAMEASDGKLTRETYVKLTEGCGSSLSRKRRKMIYDIFEIYEQMKRENGEFDLADFTNDLHRRLKHERYEGDEMNFVYVDEVQELTMSQFSLFRHVCSNVEEGFVFAGDTVQTISRGIDFRIQDIRSLFDKKFVLESKRKHKERKEKGQITNMFHLTQNFRTHLGILKLSQSIIELLYHFFARSIDIIEPETSTLHVNDPILLQSGNNEDALLKLFGDNGNIIRRSIDFGAQQVIVVRDESDRKKIKARVRNQALILTILECKDLEFEDVLLYNFFGSSPLGNQWRVIYKYMEEQGSLDSTTPTFPILDKSKHNILLAELKQLYVAISTTKQRLWISDDTEVSKPMFDFWKKKCLVKVTEVDDLLAQKMQVSSTPEEWKSRGLKLYYKHNHEMATVCFNKAGDTFWEKKSKAAGLEAMADRVRSSNPEEANSSLREAAEIFRATGKADSAARCFSDSGDYERAGAIEIYPSFGKSELQRAGDCFYLAGCYKLAADVYAKGNLFSKCLAVCTKEKLFDMGLQYLQRWKQHAKKKYVTTLGGQEIERIEQDFLESCALHYFEVKDGKSMMKVVESFASMKLVHNFLRPLGCLDELMSLEEKLGNFVEAVEIAKLKGDVLVVVDLLGKAGKFREAATLTLSYVLANSLWSSGKKGWPLQLFKQKDNLLTKAKSFAKNETQNFYEFVCAEADVMENKKSDLVMRKDQMKASLRHKSVGGEILSTRKILDAHLASELKKYLCKEDLVLDLMKHSEDIISQNQVSVESLVYFWNIWKQKIICIFEYLRHVETKDGDGFENYGEFCLSFLGVWRLSHDGNTIYVLLNSDAEWASNVEKRSVLNGGKLVSIDACQFVSAAQSYWSSEVLSVGFMVLDKLEALYTTWIEESDLLFQKCRTLTLIYEVAKFLLVSKFLKRTYEASGHLQKFLTLSADNFCAHVFPLDWRKALADSLPFLRQTEFCKNFLKQVALEYVDSRNRLSYGQIGSVAMLVLGSGKLNNELFENILKRMKLNLPWKEFFETLSRSRGSDFPNRLLLCTFQEALVDAYNATHRAEYECMSPGCFLHLVEHLLIWASSFNCCFITTKSSFVEWLVYQEIDTNNGSRSNASSDFQVSLLGVLQAIVSVIRQCLFNKGYMTEWIKRSTTRVDEHYSIFVFNMVVIICLLYANFGMCLDLLFDLLGTNYITEQLPREFCAALECRFFGFNLNVLAEAFKKTDNSLVIVSLGKNSSKYSFPDAILVDMEVNQCKNDILRTLFEKKVKALKGLRRAAAVEASDSCRERVSTSTGTAGKSSDERKHLNFELVTEPDSHTGNEHEGKSPMDYVSFWEILEGINSEESGRDERKFTSGSRTIKEDVKKYIRLLTATMTGSQQSTIARKGNNSTGEMFNMVHELMQLSAALDNGNMALVKELSKKLQSRRPRMEGVLNQLFRQQKADHDEKKLKTVVASSDQCDKEVISTSVGNISNPDKGNSKVSQASTAPENKAEAAAPKVKETEGGCYIL